MRLDYKTISKNIRQALQEDKVENDITSKFFFKKEENVKFQIVARNNGIICGIPVVKEILSFKDKNLKSKFNFNDSDKIKKKDIIAVIEGSVIILLSLERTILNFLSHLSGISTFTYEFVKLVRDFKVKITDTRKTLPGLRYLQKYAVRCGGGFNHRMDLSDMFLVKDNHIKLLMKDGYKFSDFNKTFKDIKNKFPQKKIEVEIENLKQFREIIYCYPDIILLDNMKASEVKKAIKIRNNLGIRLKKIQLEVSGGINLDNIVKYAELGVDRISIGALTNSAPVVDFAIEIKD